MSDTITTTDGRSFTKAVDYPKGDPGNPLTDAEIEEELDALAAPVLTSDRLANLKDAVANLELQGSITDLMSLTAAAS